MITAKSIVNETITLIIDNGKQIITAKSDHPKWTEIRTAFASGNNALLESLVSIKSVVESYSIGKLSVNSAGVTYDGRPMHTVDSQRVMAFLKQNLPFQPIANYIEKKAKNPSKRAIEEMYDFLENQNCPLTESGNFIAYRGVNDDYWSKTGNTETVVLQGEVDKEGRIKNSIGATIEVERSSVDDSPENDCGAGLHIGSLEYAKGWANRVILVEVDPADVVSVPKNCGCAKMRCCKYKIVGEYAYELTDAYTNEHTTKPEKTDTSKFANDSHKKLKRDGSGRFIKQGTEVKFESYDTTNTFKTTIDDSGDDVIDWVDKPCGDINSILTPVKSKFANDSYKKQKRDSNGKFIKSEPAQLEEECKCNGCCDECDKHDEFTIAELGYNDGRNDMLHGRSPSYILSDVDASVIKEDKEYINGYIAGFNS